MKTVFIVDDCEINLLIVKDALDGIYETFIMQSAMEMFKAAEKKLPDLILLDVSMPQVDGFEAIRMLKSDAKLKSVPVVFLTAHNDAASEIRGFELGAVDFIYKPCSPPVLVKRIETHIEMDKVIKRSQAAVRETHNATIRVIADMVESRDKVTGGHIWRTQLYLEILVKELVRRGIYADEIKNWDFSLLFPSSQLHDVGKIAISDTVLNKPGKLTDEEFKLIQTHCSHGEDIIDQIITTTKDDGFLHHAKMFAGYHHEKWNGKGYPRGLSGEDIPLEGRVMAIADVYDALVCERPYKKPFTHEKAVEIIKNDSGAHFDPKIVDTFLGVADNFNSMLTLTNASAVKKWENV